ncbi:aminomethyltransferase [Pseudohyphozyma bogoriensis]|nr:aminomethyltransferase [Pseudohyphozyma bogoriensis]
MSLRMLRLVPRAAKPATGLRFSSSSSAALSRTPLYAFHTDPEHGGKMVPFAGFEMPLSYAGTKNDVVAGGPGESNVRAKDWQWRGLLISSRLVLGGAVAEHHQVRNAAGLFDVGHMVQSTFTGPGALAFLSSLLPASLSTLSPTSPFRSTLSVILKPDGGILDDCMITRWGQDSFYLVTNAGRRDEDLAWISSRLDAWEGDNVNWDVLGNHGLVALQGPEAAKALESVLPKDVAALLPKVTFGSSIKANTSWGELHLARGGYTGEDGFEISIPEVKGGESEALSRALLEHSDVKLAGLAARDSLRLEAGLCLYGHDLDESIGIGEAGLAWVVGKDRRESKDFVGAERTMKELAKGGAGITRKRIGLNVEKGAPARERAKIFSPSGEEIGVVTSGLPAPTTKTNISMGYISTRTTEGLHKKGSKVLVEVRGKKRNAEVTLMPWIEVGYYRG